MSKCRECSKSGKTCCEICDVIVTNGDIARISAFTGRNDFFLLKPVSEEDRFEYANPRNVVKGSEIYVKFFFNEEGRRNVLKRNEKGQCCLLTKDGCVLPFDFKPLVCRLYPYQWNDQRDIWVDCTDCPTELFKGEQEIKEHVCVSEEEALLLVNLFYDEIMIKPDDQVVKK
jgi:uncharacterized protein